MTMASTNEYQVDLAQEGSFESVEHSHALSDQCQEATTALATMKRKVHVLEQQLAKEIKKAKVCQG